jgi:hypothetical protein
VPAATTIRQILTTTVHSVGRDQLARLALMARLATRVAHRALVRLRAERRRSALDFGGSDDGGIELLPESRFSRRSSSSMRSSSRRITASTASTPSA